MKNTITILGGALLSISASAFQPIDMKALKYLEFGYNPTIGSYTPGDGEGAVSSGSDATFLTVAAKLPYKGKNQRSWFDLSYQYFETNAGVSEFGQQIQRYKAQWLHQKANVINKTMTAWYGGGAAVGFSNYTGKHTVTSEGHLNEWFEDSTGFDLGVVGSVALEFRVPSMKRYKFGVNAQYEVPLTDSVTGFTMGAYVFYKF